MMLYLSKTSRWSLRASSMTLILSFLLQEHPTLAQEELPSSAPSAILGSSTTVSPTIDVSSSPYPNACDNITIGNFYFLSVNSIDSASEVSIFGFEDLPPDLDLYLTDNAWTGESFATDEGIMVLTTPPQGIPAGMAFGLGPSTTAYQYGQDWMNAQGVFSLSTEGDQVFLFCISAQQVVRPVAAISYNGPFQPAGLASYGTNESALPDSLALNGTLVLPHEDRWMYVGPDVLEMNALKDAIQDTATNWEGNSDGSASGGPAQTGVTTILVYSMLLASTSLLVLM